MTLIRQLHGTPFRWSVHNDDNRGEDGKELREEFLDEFGYSEPDWPEVDASMFEVLIALSRRAAYNSYGTPASWFWKMLENLGFRHYSDANYNNEIEEEVDEVLQIVLDRTYSEDGRGGLFPLRSPHLDQRRIELWYQLSAYILEGGDVDNGP